MKPNINETNDREIRAMADTRAVAEANKVTLPDLQTVAGLVVRVLIGEPSFKNSVDDWPIQKKCMTALAALLYNRVHSIPSKYTQQEIAGVTTTDYREILAARNQFDGFGKDASGDTLTEKYSGIVDGRVALANTGTPGPLTDAINHALTLAKQLESGRFDSASDPFINVVTIGAEKTTGRSYYMKTKGSSRPVAAARPIPTRDDGDLAGNTFYTLVSR